MRFSDLKRPIYEARDFQIDSTEHELQVLIANAKDLLEPLPPVITKYLLSELNRG